MRMLAVIIGSLITLGLAAFGIIAAQKTVASPSPAAATPAVPSGGQAASAPARAAIVHTADDMGSTAVSSPAPVGPVSPLSTRVAQNTEKATVSAAGAPATGAAATPTGAAAATPTGVAGATPTSTIAPCDKPGGMGVARVVEIDTTGGPGFGFEHFKQYDFLRDKEVVLTFDDGPWPENTPAVIKALADNCVKATFFEIGEHATWHPEITKQVIEAGNTVGSHTWSHKDLARNPYASDLEAAKREIEMGVSAVHIAAAAPIAPFFRFPDLQHPPALLSYLAERNIASFSTDIDSFDFRMRKPEQVVKSVMSKLEKRGKGIILMHDFRHATAEAMPELLRQLKAGGYKFVHMVPRAPVVALAGYDEMVTKMDKLSVTNTRPVSSVVRTIGE